MMGKAHKQDSPQFDVCFNPGSLVKSLKDLVKMSMIGEGSNAKVFRAYFKCPLNQKHFIYAAKVHRFSDLKVRILAIFLIQLFVPFRLTDYQKCRMRLKS
jgi:hypothetical protein